MKNYEKITSEMSPERLLNKGWLYNRQDLQGKLDSHCILFIKINVTEFKSFLNIKNSSKYQWLVLWSQRGK